MVDGELVFVLEGLYLIKISNACIVRALWKLYLIQKSFSLKVDFSSIRTMHFFPLKNKNNNSVQIFSSLLFVHSQFLVAFVESIQSRCTNLTCINAETSSHKNWIPHPFSTSLKRTNTSNTSTL